MRKAAGQFERCYAYVGVVYYEQGIIQALRAARGAEGLRPGASDPVSSVTQLSILFVMLFLLAARWRQYARLVKPVLPYVAIIVLSFVSAAWSDNPSTTLRRSASLLTCVLFGVYLTHTFGLRRVLMIAGQCAVFLGVLSIAVFVAAPKIGRETALGYETAMRGVFSQKNPMAECMLLGITCYAFRILDEGLRRSHVACIALLLLCIALGRSATSLGIAFLVLLIASFMGLRSRPRMRLVLGCGTGWIILAITVIALVAPDALFKLAGRDASLTGRGPLWQEVLGVIAEKPLLGHGYAGFWSDDSRTVQYLWLRAGWKAPDSHNGYLDVMVQLGVAGLALFLFMWGRATLGALASARAGTLREAPWIVLFMLVNITLNLDEGPMPFSDEFTMLMPGALMTLGAWRMTHSGRVARTRFRPVRVSQLQRAD